MREEKFETAFKLLIQSQSSEGAGTFGTLLHLAISKLQYTHINILLQRISVNCIEPLNGDTPLH